MNVLCVARYFPSYFRALVQYLAAQPDNNVTFVTERCHKELLLPNVTYKVVRFTPPNYKGADRKHLLQMRRTQAFGKALEQLRAQGLQPDVLLQDMLSPCTYALNTLFPCTPLYLHIGECRSDGQGEADNLLLTQVMQQARGAFVRYAYQKEGYPSLLQEKIHVIHEGVDTKLFAPGEAVTRFADSQEESPWEIVTMHIRCVEAALTNDIFFRVIQRLLERRPQCHLVIMGRRGKMENSAEPMPDIFAHAPQSQAFFTSMSHRVHFIRAEGQPEYRSILRASRIHLCAFNQRAVPFGTLEAMSSGCLLVGTDMPPLNTMLKHGINSVLCDFSALENTVERLDHMISSPQDYVDIRKNARQRICERYDLEKNVRQHCQMLALRP